MGALLLLIICCPHAPRRACVHSVLDKDELRPQSSPLRLSAKNPGTGRLGQGNFLPEAVNQDRAGYA